MVIEAAVCAAVKTEVFLMRILKDYQRRIGIIKSFINAQ